MAIGMLSKVIETLSMSRGGLEQPHNTDTLNVVIGEVDCRAHIVILWWTVEHYFIVKFLRFKIAKAITRS